MSRTVAQIEEARLVAAEPAAAVGAGQHRQGRKDSVSAMSIAWFIARPKLTLAILFTLALAGWHWQDKISDWFDARKIQKLEARVADLEEYKRNAEATQKAAREARGRNDEVIPKARHATAERIARADTADAEQRLLDDQAAQAEYAEAAGIVRGKGAR